MTTPVVTMAVVVMTTEATAPMNKRKAAEIFAVYTFPCGSFRIEQAGDCIVSISTVNGPVPNYGTPTPLTQQLASQMEEYFQGNRKTFDIPYILHGTPFQERVWQALCRIPYGRTRSYRDIAEEIGQPKACRAVGMANHRNPMMLVIPCHRVIGADGSLGGYAGGLELKRFLLSLEQNHAS